MELWLLFSLKPWRDVNVIYLWSAPILYDLSSFIQVFQSLGLNDTACNLQPWPVSRAQNIAARPGMYKMAFPNGNFPDFLQLIVLGFFIMLYPAYHHSVEDCQSSLKPVFITYTQTPYVLPFFSHTHLLHDMRWVYNTYTSDWYFSDFTAYSIHSLYQDFCIYKSGFLNFHPNSYCSTILLHMSCMWMS